MRRRARAARRTDDPVILEEAAGLVDGDRQAVYGDATVNHQRIANLWNARFAEKMTVPFTAAEVACAMRLVKEARLMQTPGHADSLVDIAAYAEVEARIHGTLSDKTSQC